MKLIPNAVSRAVALQGLKASKNAPSLLFGAGLVGVVGSTVLACKATLKLEEELDHIQNDLQNVHAEVYNERDHTKAVAKTYLYGTGRLVKLYSPAILVGGVSVACLTKSHHILNDRNAALGAAYAAVDQGMKKYRSNATDMYGPEVDHKLRHGRAVMVEKDGAEWCELVMNDAATPSMYSKIFDQTNENWAEAAEYNYAWLRHKEDWLNHLLTMRGYLYLNEVYEELGFEPTEAGNVVGWFLGNGDNYVDLHLFKRDGSTNDFINGHESSVLLDFNVDGSIFHLMDQVDHGKLSKYIPWQR